VDRNAGYSFRLAYRDALAPTREKSLYELINNTHMNDSAMIQSASSSPWFRREVNKRQETAPPLKQEAPMDEDRNTGNTSDDGRACA
jgi:hypothetical protein